MDRRINLTDIFASMEDDWADRLVKALRNAKVYGAKEQGKDSKKIKPQVQRPCAAG